MTCLSLQRPKTLEWHWEKTQRQELTDQRAEKSEMLTKSNRKHLRVAAGLWVSFNHEKSKVLTQE